MFIVWSSRTPKSYVRALQVTNNLFRLNFIKIMAQAMDPQSYIYTKLMDDYIIYHQLKFS